MEKYIRKARKLIKSNRKKHTLISFGLDKRGRIISIGFNSYKKTHPKQKQFAEKIGNTDKIYLHSEIDCIIKGRGKIYKIVIIRLNARLETRLAKPCPICEQAILDANIKFIEYSL